jgi:excisionase family DNA binding protein
VSDLVPGELRDTLSLQEAADLCGVAYRTMRAMILRGDLPAEKAGAEWRLRRADVDAFIEHSRVQPGEVKAAPKRMGPKPRGRPASS